MNIIETIRAEIERRRNAAKYYDMSGGDAPIYDDLLAFLDTLEAEEKTPKIYEATCVDFDDDGTPIFYGDSKIPDLELDDKITFRLWWKKKK